MVWIRKGRKALQNPRKEKQSGGYFENRQKKSGLKCGRLDFSPYFYRQTHLRSYPTSQPKQKAQFLLPSADWLRQMFNGVLPKKNVLMPYRYLLSLLLACTTLCPSAVAQAEYLAPVTDYDLQAPPIESWAIGEYLYFAHPALQPHGSIMRRVPELWAVHLPSGQAWKVDFPEGEQFQLAAQQGDALYCYASAEPAQRHLYRLEGGAIQSRAAVPKIVRLIPVPDWGKGISFIAEYASNFWQWWISDGTADGTAIRTQGVNANAAFAMLGEQLIFMGPNNRLYTSDGAADGTAPIAQLSQAATDFQPMGQFLLFNLGEQVWRTDGTAEGTFALVTQRRAAQVSVVGNSAVLLMQRLSNGINEVWRTDGTLAGTRQLLTLHEHFPQVFALGSHHYIIGKEAFDEHLRCWRFDGTLGGVPAALPGNALHHLSNVLQIVPTPETWVLLEGDTEESIRTVLVFDGSEAYPVDYWPATSHLSFGSWDDWYLRTTWSYLRYLDGHIYTPMQYAHLGTELWRIGSDGSTALVADIAPGVRWSHPRPLAAWDGQIFFLGKMPGRGPALLRAPSQGQAAVPPLSADYNWLQALTPSWSRASAGSSTAVYSSQVVVSTAGHVYVAGESNGQAGLAFPGQEVILPPAAEWRPNLHYLAKLDGTTGRVQWARDLAYDFSKYLSFDVLLAPAPDDGIYVANIFHAEAVFGDTIITTTQRQAYFARFDSSGQVRWHLTAQLGPAGGPLAIMAGQDGMLYVLGQFDYYQGRLGDQLLTSPHSPALFLAQISPQGEVLEILHLDLPFRLQQLRGVAALAQSPDGGIYVSLSEAGPNFFQPCDFRPMIILLCRISADLKRIAWQRELIVDDLAYANVMTRSPEGLLYLAGPYRGTFTAGGHTISAPCTKPSSFIAIINPLGQVQQLIDVEQGQTTLHDLQFEPDGTYLLAGIERHEERERYYDGYAEFPFANGRMTAFVQRRCPHRHELLSERRFLKPNAEEFRVNHPRLAVLPSGGIVLQDRLSAISIMDTLAGIPLITHGSQAVLLSFELPLLGSCPELTAPGLDVPLDFSLAPNPTHDYAWLSMPVGIDADLLRLSLRTIAGQDVPLHEIGGDRTHRQINLSGLPAGVYVLSAQYGNRRANLKIVKQ